jgi:hypothetical protein
LRGLRWEDYDGEQVMVMRSVWEGFTNEPKTTASRQCRSSYGCRRYSQSTRNPKTGPIFANGKGMLANLNNVLNRQILPVLNRCGSAEKKGSVTPVLRFPTNTWGMVVNLSGTGSTVFAGDPLPRCTLSEWMK